MKLGKSFRKTAIFTSLSLAMTFMMVFAILPHDVLAKTYHVDLNIKIPKFDLSLPSIDLNFDLTHLNPEVKDSNRVSMSETTAGLQDTGQFQEMPSAVYKLNSDNDTAIQFPSKKISLKVPRGASPTSLEINVTECIPENNGGIRMLSSFKLEANKTGSPDEKISHFSKELEITINHTEQELRGININTLRLYYLDPTSSQWKPVPSSFDPQTMTLTAKLSHFSEYGEQADPIINQAAKIMNTAVNLQKGTSTFTYPIEVPPGPAKFQPQIQLNYNSGIVDNTINKRASASWVGMGWNLHLGKISYDSLSDRYTLDLNNISYDLVSTTSNNTSYKTMLDSFFKISRNGNTWEIINREGTYYRFGGTANSTQYYVSSGTTYYYRWDLNLIKDVNNNQIVVTYSQSLVNGSVRSAWPQSVVYGNNRIDFIVGYDQSNTVDGNFRNDNPPTFNSLAAPVVMDDRRLDAILVKSGSILIRKYQFSYNTTNAVYSTDYGGISYSGELTLSSITQIGSDGVSQLPSISFTYQKLPKYRNDRVHNSYVGNPGNPATINSAYLTSIDSGYGGTITIGYSQTDNTTTKNTWTRELVTSKTIDSGIGPVESHTYSYSDGPKYCPELVDTPDYLGFGQVTENDSAGNYIKHFYYTQGYQNGQISNRFAGREYDTKWYASDNTFLKETTDNMTWTQSLRVPYNFYTGNISHFFNNTLKYFNAYGAIALSKENNIYIPDLDGGTTCIVVLDPNGNFIRKIGNSTYLQSPVGIAISSDNNTFVADSAKKVVQFDPSGNFVRYITNNLSAVTGIAISPENKIYVTDDSYKRVTVFDSNCNFIRNIGSSTYLRTPTAVAVSSDNRTFVADIDRVTVFDSSGNYSKQITSWTENGVQKTFHSPTGLNISSDGYLYVTDSYLQCAVVFDPSDNYVGNVGGSTYLQQPLGVAISDDNYAYILDNQAHGIVQFRSALDAVATKVTQVNSIEGSKNAQIRYQYDTYNNVITEYHDGDTSNSTDDFTIWRTFYPNPTTNILGKPAQERVYASIVTTDQGGNNLKKETNYYFDGNNTTISTPPAKGNLTRQEAKIDNSTSSSAYQTYDIYGNIISSTDANGNTMQIKYDPVYHVYPQTKIYPVVGMSESYVYDAGTNNLLSQTDINGQITSYQYDTFKRLLKTITFGDSAASPSVQCQYNDFGTLNQQNVTTLAKISSDNYTWQKQFFDGIGRVIQTQSQGETGRTIIQSTASFNRRGLKDKVYVSQDIDSTQVNGYKAPEDNWKYSTSTYDGLGRAILLTASDNTSIAHDFSTPWKDVLTDQNGHKKAYYYDAFKHLIKVEELDQNNQIYATTQYSYDTLGNLVKTQDAQSNNTTMSYDWLGRKTGMTDPDMGTWTYNYDNNGNLASQTDAKGQTINLSYDALNRVTTKSYPAGSGMTDVNYHYDSTQGDAAPAVWPHDENLGTLGVGPFFTNISGLTKDTTYYYQCAATSSSGVAWAGSASSFTPGTPTLPTISNSIGATNVNGYHATLNGQVTRLGVENPEVHIYWGTTDNGTDAAAWQHNESLGNLGIGQFSKNIFNLSSGTTYYYRCAATDANGTAWSSATSSFTTANNSWLQGWNYRKQAKINGSTTDNVTDYQIKLNLNYGSGSDVSPYYQAVFAMNADYPYPIPACQYSSISTTPYTTQAGDCLEYDIYWTSAKANISFVISPSDGSPIAGNDQYGYNLNPTTDISSKALNNWYSRKIRLIPNKTAYYYDIACQSDTSGTRTAYLRNIRITDGNGNIRKVILMGHENRPNITIHYCSIQNNNFLTSFTQQPCQIFLNSKGKSDFSDVRFTNSDGVSPLNYWFESKTDNVSATCWVKCDSIPITGTSIYLYFGNQSASSASNGDNTFIFFDHFDGSFPGTKWTGDTDYGTVSNSKLTMTGSNLKTIKGSTSLGSTRGAWRANLKFNSDGWGDAAAGLSSNSNSRYFYHSYNMDGWYYSSCVSFNGYITGSIWTAGCYNIWDILTDYSSSETKFLCNGYNVKTLSAPNDTSLKAAFTAVSNTTPIECDWVLLRNWIPNEPGWGIWSAEENNGLIATVTNASGASTITRNSAKLNGEMTSTSGYCPVVHIYWGMQDGGTTPANWQHDNNIGTRDLGAFSANITGLTADTTYYYRSCADNTTALSWAASTASFKTQSAGDWLPGWNYRKKLSVIGSTDGLQSDYPINLKANYGSGIDSIPQYRAVFHMMGSDNYQYSDISSVSNYTIQPGDYLEYDVYWTSVDDKCAFTLGFADYTKLWDIAGVMDQNQLNAHPSTDISTQALNKWYSRKILLPESCNGKTANKYDIACEYDSYGNKTAYFKNIRITNGSGTTRKWILVGNEPSVTTTTDISSNASLTSFTLDAAQVFLNSKCKTDFGDIRFTASDGTILLDYWVESKTDLNNAVIWVELSSIAAYPNTTDFYIYYGKYGDGTDWFLDDEFVRKYAAFEPFCGSIGPEENTWQIAYPSINVGDGASHISSTTARMNGILESTGGENPTVHIFWGTDNTTWQHNEDLGVRGLGSFNTDLTGLTVNTTYYYLCSATNSIGTSWSSIASFVPVDVKWLPGWDSRKQITVNGSTDKALSYYQLKLNVFYSSGTDGGNTVYLNSKCKPDFSDIRFTKSDGVTPIDHWIESKTDNSSALIWIECDAIPQSPGTAKFYIYCNNGAAGNNTNGTETIIFADDFERGNNGDDIGGDWYSSGQGEAVVSTAQASNGTRSLKIMGSNEYHYAYTEKTPGTDYSISFKMYQTPENIWVMAHGNETKRIMLFCWQGYLNYTDDTGDHYLLHVDTNSWRSYAIKNINWIAGTYDIWFENSLIKSGANMESNGENDGAIMFVDSASGAGNDFYVDDFTISQFIPKDPLYSNGVNTFVLFDDFERDTNGGSVGGCWYTSDDVNISTARSSGGTRSVKISGSDEFTWLAKDLLPGTDCAVDFQIYQNPENIFNLVVGNGSKRIFIYSWQTYICYMDNNGDYYLDLQIPANTWEKFTFKNVDWNAGTYDIWHGDTLIKSNAAMQTSSENDGIAFCGDPASGQGDDLFIDNVFFRKDTANEPTFGNWGTEELNQQQALAITNSNGASNVTDSGARLNGEITSTGGEDPVVHIYWGNAGPNYGKGKRTSMTDASGSTSYTYDARGRVIVEKRTIDSIDYITRYSYDGLDRLVSVTYPTGETVTTTYNERGIPYSLNGSVVGDLVTGTSYNQLGQVTEIDLGNGLKTTFGYWGIGGANDNPGGYYGKLWEIKTAKTEGGPVLQDVQHTWDAVGNLTQRTDVISSETENFSYDFLDRLTGVSGPYSESFSYNQIGNIITKNGTSYIYGAKPHAVTAVGATNYVYDANGNMTNRGSQVLTWDVENRPVSISENATTSTFVYDGDGKRVKKTEGGQIIIYLSQYYEKNVTTSNETSNYYLGSRIIAQKKGAVLQYLHQDHLTGTSLSSDSSGDLVSTIKYFSFGATRSGFISTEIKFTGQRLDNTGLYYYGARYYDAQIGRFISADILISEQWNPQSHNRYAYVYNNPLKYTDPLGLWGEGSDYGVIVVGGTDSVGLDGTKWVGEQTGIKSDMSCAQIQAIEQRNCFITALINAGIINCDLSNLYFVPDDKGGLNLTHFDASSREAAVNNAISTCGAKNISLIGFSEGCSVIANWALLAAPGDSQTQKVHAITLIECPRWIFKGYIHQMAQYLPAILWAKGYRDIRYAAIYNAHSPISGSLNTGIKMQFGPVSYTVNFWEEKADYSLDNWKGNFTPNLFEYHHPFYSGVVDMIRWTMSR